MVNTRPSKNAWLLLAIVGIQLRHVHAQAARSTHAVPSLQNFFEELVQRYSPSSLPKYDELSKVTDRIAGARPEDISKALPAIFAALAHRDETVSAYADSALFRVARRTDGAELLRSWINALGQQLLTSHDSAAQRSEVAILGSLEPRPPPEAMSVLLTFLKRTHRDAQAQAGAIFELMRFAPQSPDVVAAILAFLDRPLNKEARIAVLNALGTPQVSNPNIIGKVIASLDDPDPAIRFTAAQVLPRMGQRTLLQAKPMLQSLSEDQDQPIEVRDAAAKALQQIRPQAD